jgi:hypothetical protein
MTDHVKLRAGLPEGDADGLQHYAKVMIDEPERMRLLVALVEPRQTITDELAHETTVALGFVRCELVVDEFADRDTLHAIMVRAAERRSAEQPALPLDDDQAGPAAAGRKG